MIARWFRRRTPVGEVLLFDYDGVIADSEAVCFEEFTRACAEMGFDWLNSREAFLRLFDHNLALQLVRAGFPLRRLRQLAEQFRPRMVEANRRIRPFPGMPELIGRLATRHPLHIITSNATETVAGFLADYGVEGVRSVIGADQETSKVKKIRMVLRREPGRRAWYIGDTRGDMVEARRARVHAVGVAWGWHDEARLRSAHPVCVARTQGELLGWFDRPVVSLDEIE